MSAAVVRNQPVVTATGPAPPPDRTTTTPTVRSETTAATAGTHHHASRPVNLRPSTSLSQAVGRTRVRDRTAAVMVVNTAITGSSRTSIAEPPTPVFGDS